MTRTSPPQVAFSSGELDPLLHRRFDYARFQTGLARCCGFLPLAQGGFTRAPGTIFRGTTRLNGAAVLVPFEFASNDAVLLEFTDGIMRVWRYGAPVLSGGSPYQLATPFGAASLAALQWVQSADVIYLADGINPIQRLARLALNNWTISAAAFDTGPFRVQNLNAGHTIQAGGATGSIPLTASAALFAANHVGSLIKLVPSTTTAVALWTSNEPLTVGNTRRYGKNTYELIAGTNAGANPPIHTEGDARTDNATTWRFLDDGVGIARITAVASPVSATATVLKRLPQSVVSTPTYRWSEGAWSARYGYPATLEIYEQRLVAAATPAEPRTVWFSAVGDYADFNDGIEADSAFAYTIAGEGSVNRVQTLKRGKTGLHIFALGEESSSRSDSRSQVIGPTTARFGLDSSIGAALAKPIAPGGNPIFISRDGRRVVMIQYSYEQDGNQALTLSRPAQHLGAGIFQQIVWQASPEPTAWLRRASGDLVAMVYDPAEEVLGWATVPVAGGFVESLAVHSDLEGAQDVVTMVVRRQINGATVRFIEEMALTFGVLTGAQPIAEACHFYASGVFTPGSPASVFTLAHLVGQTVYAWTDKGEFGPFTVPPDGAVTLPVAVNRAVIGLFDATHFAETLDIQAATANGSSIGRQKGLAGKPGIGLHRTAQGYVQTVERDFAQPERAGARRTLVARSVGSDLTQAFSGITQAEILSGMAAEQVLRFTPYSGAPMTVTAVVPTIQEAGS